MPKADDVGVGASLLMLREGKILLGLRKSALNPGFWCCPGGWLEREDETPAHGVCREVLEETGVRVLPGHALPLMWTSQDHASIGIRSVTLFHVATQWSGIPKVMEPDKCEAWEWFGLDDLPEPLYPGMLEVVPVVKAWAFHDEG